MWIYLEYGLECNTDNTITRIKVASTYFDKANSGQGLSKENFQMAKTYYNIGYFYKNISSLVREGNDNNDTYSDFWSNINNMISFIEQNNANNDLIFMETYNIAINALRSYSEKFASAGITYEQQNDLFSKIKTEVNKTNIAEPSDDNYRNAYDIKKNIVSIYDDTQTQIKIAYKMDVKQTSGSEVNN